jgi:hypothetical protein
MKARPPREQSIIQGRAGYARDYPLHVRPQCPEPDESFHSARLRPMSRPATPERLFASLPDTDPGQPVSDCLG